MKKKKCSLQILNNIVEQKSIKIEFQFDIPEFFFDN